MRTSQWVVREIVELDRRHIKTILHNMEAIRKALDKRYDEIQSLRALCAKLKIPDVFRTFPGEGNTVQVEYICAYISF